MVENMLKIETRINYELNKYPIVKIYIKKIYQIVMHLIYPRINKQGELVRISPDNYSKEYFFGYYDKSPWDITDRFALCLGVENAYKDAAPKAQADIILIDTFEPNKYQVIANTNAWNVQQGCMLQWLGDSFNKQIIFNDFRDNNLCAIILDVESGKEKIIERPIYSVSRQGDFALTLDFCRLNRLAKGYGYSNLEDKTYQKKVPDGYCVWRVDLVSGNARGILKYTDLIEVEPRKEMLEAEHKVNHIMISPSGKRFMFLHRWIKNGRKYTRLLTCDIDGKNLHNLSDDDMVSHCTWQDENYIFAYCRKNDQGNGYYLMRDKTSSYTRFWHNIENDGHPSFSPDGSFIVTDTYPDRRRLSSLLITTNDDMTGERTKILAKVYSPFRYDNDVRCDLHPRWNNKGDKICIDAVFEEKRGLYVIEVNKNE